MEESQQGLDNREELVVSMVVGRSTPLLVVSPVVALIVWQERDSYEVSMLLASYNHRSSLTSSLKMKTDRPQTLNNMISW